MLLDLLTAVDESIRRPEGELAPIFSADLGQVRRLNFQLLSHCALTLPVSPMADCTILQKLTPPVGNACGVLRQPRARCHPEQDCRNPPSQAFPLCPPRGLRLYFHKERQQETGQAPR